MPGSRSSVQVTAHPLLELGVLWAEWPAPLGSLSAPGWLDLLTGAEAEVALPPPDALVRREVRGLLRQGGFSPSGRNKPCSEWIAGVASKGDFPRISPAVDACNAACLHGGLPISTVDADRLVGALRVDVAPVGSEYVFNRSGQVLRLAGLLCLFDQEGPCANAVKDAQRTKTDEGTVRTLSLVWGTRALPGKTEEIVGWYRGVMERLGAEVALG